MRLRPNFRLFDHLLYTLFMVTLGGTLGALAGVDTLGAWGVTFLVFFIAYEVWFVFLYPRLCSRKTPPPASDDSTARADRTMLVDDRSPPFDDAGIVFDERYLEVFGTDYDLTPLRKLFEGVGE